MDIFLVLVVLSQLVAPVGANEEIVHADQTNLQGIWRLESFRSGDKYSLAINTGSMEIKGDHVQILLRSNDRPPMDYGYTLRLSVQADGTKRFDQVFNEGRVIHGIYKFEDGRLYRCSAGISGKNPPRDFNDGAYSVWTRATSIQEIRPEAKR